MVDVIGDYMTTQFFRALIKKYTPLTLVSGDKQVQITLYVEGGDVTKELLDRLSALYDKTPEQVWVMMLSEADVKKFSEVKEQSENV